MQGALLSCGLGRGSEATGLESGQQTPVRAVDDLAVHLTLQQGPA